MRAGSRDFLRTLLSRGADTYEQDALTAVRELLTRSAPNLARWEKRILAVSLEGQHPDTRLVVDYRDDHAGERCSRAFALWRRNPETGEAEPEDSPGSWAVIVRENIEVPAGV
jgi:hypothetical protein